VCLLRGTNWFFNTDLLLGSTAPLRALTFPATDGHSSLPTAFCRHLLTLWPYILRTKKGNVTKYRTFCREINCDCAVSLKKIYNEIYLLIKCTKSFLWREQERLSYVEDAWCLKVNLHLPHIFEPSQSPPSPSSSLRFTLKYFLNCPSLNNSCYMSSWISIILVVSCLKVWVGIYCPTACVRLFKWHAVK